MTRALALVAVAGALAALQACNSTGGGTSASGSRAGVTLDGRTDEWRSTTARADSDHVYFRVQLPGNTDSIQQSGRTLALWLDTDADAYTGYVSPQPAGASGLGVDLEIQFSPSRWAESANPEAGAAAYTVSSSGEYQRFNPGEAGLSFQPTYAAPEYEVRLSRRLPNMSMLPSRGLPTQGRLSGLVVLMEANGDVAWAGTPFTVNLPPAAPAAALANAVIPAKESGAIRVVSYNMRNSAGKTPEPFARVITALNPDIILFQEWGEGDALAAEQWLQTQVPSPVAWRAVRGGGDGIIIAARHPLDLAGPESIGLDEFSSARPVRYLAAVVYPPLGAGSASAGVVVGNVHLKCCGGAGGPEEERRQAEASAINTTFRQTADKAGSLLRIIGGDFNLVGTRMPLDLAAAGLDADGSDLTAADPEVLGDPSTLTWSDPASNFAPSRLDYVLYSDSTLRVVRSFVFDTRRLSDTSLAAIGLDRGDAAASDHMPLVVDLKRK